MKQNHIFSFIGICSAVLLAGDSFGVESEGAAATPPTHSSPAVPMDYLTLDEAIQLALKNNPGLEAAAGRIEASKGQAIQAGLWSNPELELRAEDVPQRGGGFSQSKNFLGVSQTVPFPGKKSLERRAGRVSVKASEAEFSSRKLELVRDVKISFFRVLAAERRLQITEELLKLAETSANTARKRVEAGAAPDQEQLRAEIELERNGTELANLKREGSESRAELASLLRMPELKTVPVQGELAARVDFHGVDGRGADFLGHPELEATRAARKKADLELRRAKLNSLPDVTLGIAGGRDEARDENLLEFRLSLPLPIFDRGKGRLREAKAYVSIAAAEMASTEQRLIRNLSSTEARLHTASQQVETYKDRILPKAERALRMVQGGYEEGKFDFITLLDTQRTTAEARLAYQEKLLELNIAQAELEAVLNRNKERKEESNYEDK